MELKEKVYLKLLTNSLFDNDVKTAVIRISNMFHISEKAVADALKQLLLEKRIYFSNKDKLIKNLVPTKKGIFKDTTKSFGYVNVDGESQDYYVSNKNNAMHEDVVEVAFLNNSKGKKECFILKVIERKAKIVMGQVAKSKNDYVFIPDNLNISQKLILRQDEQAKLALGKKVAYTIDYFDNSNLGNYCFGHVSKIFGKAGDPIVENQAIAFEFGFVKDFSNEIEMEVAKISKNISNSELSKRVDLRHLPFVTIDPYDCKDKDDAVYVEKIENGFRAFVAIADVSHYVKKGSLVDQEAYNRGTSCYLGDGVYPMLPEKLSNDICSLNEGVDKLALTAVVDVDLNGNIKKYDIIESVIKIKHCLSYEVVEDIYLNKNNARKEFSDIVNNIDILYQINEILSKNRRGRGELNFVSNEPTFKFDKTKTNVKEVLDKNNLQSKKVIESLMILANEAVGLFFIKNNFPTLFRIHDKPNEEKIEKYSPIFDLLGLDFDGDVSSEGIQNLLRQIKGHPSEQFINDTILRCMSKAKYHPDNIGHYGLGSKNYIHFTSPIRRYPDTLVHRQIHEIIATKKTSLSLEELYKIGSHLTDREGKADSAERMSDNLLMTIWAENHINEVFECKIVCFDNNFMKLKYGLVEFKLPYSELSNNSLGFKTNESKVILKNLLSGKEYKVGDSVKVKIISTDRNSRTIITSTDLQKEKTLNKNIIENQSIHKFVNLKKYNKLKNMRHGFSEIEYDKNNNNCIEKKSCVLNKKKYHRNVKHKNSTFEY